MKSKKSEGGFSLKGKFKVLKRKVVNSAIATTVLAGTFFAPILPTAVHATGETNVEETTPVVDLRILETSDIHTNILNYDYFQDKSTESFGLSKAATKIKELKKGATNSLLFDNGDLIQGNPLGDYIARETDLSEGDVHPAIKALNVLGYDGGTVGNHEFNFGLDFLNEALDDADYPVVNANVYKPDGVTPYFDQYEIIKKQVTDSNGDTHTINVGVTGFVPPQILNWDYGHLNGKVVVKDIVESAKAVVPQMKAEGADVVVLLSHAGIDDSGYVKGMEDASYYLTEVPDVDAVLTGHAHAYFPAAAGEDQDFPDGNGFDNAKGTINGVPVTMPGSWADSVGQIDLKMEEVTDGEWDVVDSQAKLVDATGDDVASDSELEAAIDAEHKATVDYVNKAVGNTTAPINSYFALVQDDPSVQIVNDAQKAYVEKWITGFGSEYADLPVLSSAAPFKAGGRDGSDASYFTDIPAGGIAIKNVADLYLYPNTVYALKINGSELKEWIEWSAGQFNQIDPNTNKEQPLINYNFRSYNFDVIDGVTYEIDVTQPAKYDGGQNLINPDASRVKNLQYEGQPVTEDMEFIVATNNYRAGTNKIVNPDGKNTVLVAPDENRQAIINYITDSGGTLDPSADGNWKLADFQSPVNVTFNSAVKATTYLDAQSNIKLVESNGDLAKYAILPEDYWQLRVLHTNDTHAHLDDVARRVTLTEQKRSEVTNSLLLDAGDVFSGDLYFTKWAGQEDLGFMNRMGYDAMVPGNHEFDKGPTVLANFIKNATFPIVSSNIDYTNENELSGLLEAPGTFEGAGIYPYVVIDVNGEKVGLFGLTTEDTPEASSPGEDIVFNSATASAKETVEALTTKEGVNKIITLSHLGYNKDLALAEAVEGIDIIIGGHTHTQLEDETLVNNDDTPTVVTTAYQYGELLGSLDVVFDAEGIVLPEYTDGEFLSVENVEEDPEAKVILDELKAELDALKTEVVGNSDVVLDGERQNVRTKETNLGNLITDGMLAKAKQTEKGADFAITNGGGIRASIDKGEITLGEVLTTMPFGNTLAVVDVTGAQVIEALENGVSGAHLEDLPGKFPQVSGLKFTFDKTQPVGDRIVSVEVLGENGKYSPIDLDKKYRVATNAFMAAGGDGYDVFKDTDYMEDLGIVDYEVFVEYLNSLEGNANPTVEGRILEVSAEDPVVTPDPDPIDEDKDDEDGKEDGKDNVKDQPSNDQKTVILKPTVKNGKATIDNKSIEKVKDNTETIVVELDDKKATKANFTLTKENISLLKEKGIEKVVLSPKGLDVSISIPVSQLPDGADVEVKRLKDSSDKKFVSGIYDFTVKSGNDTLHQFDEPLELVFEIDEKLVKNTDNLEVVYFNENTKEWEIVPGATYANGKVTVTTTHLSIFAVVEVENQDEVAAIAAPSDEEYKLPNTATSTFNWITIGMMMLLLGGLFLLKQNRRKA
ncbi:bifunctional 2',3'-cyclic-nucleotide 2'-phosphodiesterase/3'-nucleotidase [Aquibacillus kalidii]|uniref:bifunctional 2',3'-cyclic-nucleotide 2'-phosphodiesterase/3'-nucleotidase n=1 Tax=Aquibacillus kalidii TaxID=2762597 RepID=UPI0016447156|nr:bifunctional 2',3'-cyclic-nucleotide 2'-phosphodiesterase/3'-nucleotidase [Aquibacillus kalidii]